MRHTLHIGNNLEVLPTLPDNSVDAIVTDPPYGLVFMGKDWDKDVPGPDTWRECLRVLKPGGHLLAFAGTRTQHKMATAIELAGFEVRDLIAWVYGSGFPKSHNISKAFNKAAGVQYETKPAEGVGFMKADGANGYNPTINQMIQVGESSAEAKQWDGWGTALKPAMEPITVARKPLEGTVAANVLKHGTGAINIDACRVGDEGGCAGACAGAARVFSNHLNGAFAKPVPGLGRWPANLIHDGSEEVLQLFPETGVSQGGRSGNGNAYGGGFGADHYGDEKPGYGDKGSAARFFYCPKANKKDRDEGCEEMPEVRESDREKDNGIGGDNLRNRTNNPRKNHHPTVKPTDLMRYLCRLVTPPGGTVLDPFTGSGSTGKAAILEGFNFIGIELSPEYAAIAEARIRAAYNPDEA